ncbi:PaaI family thioesterase [Tistrella mobilis]|uniref:Thioesterase superfamily protein n=1 Tax=Tistrella mobilis (strain KA081020-065) TaxID=1110502 RepID=I3TQ52_TISMK|nr:PaaI family thioesterase [Tistrella mobilis]AFK54890.1 thioesterase superfamily protein [Tistrella mobilis KA081020-065]
MQVEPVETSSVPEGFMLHDRRSPVTDPWRPIWAKRSETAFHLGLYLAEAHTNSRGLAHGGLISALADNAMGLTCWLHRPESGGLVTVNLSVDFMGAGRIGQWLEIRPEMIRTGQTLAFARALILADDAVIAQAAATFHVAPPRG